MADQPKSPTGHARPARAVSQPPPRNQTGGILSNVMFLGGLSQDQKEKLSNVLSVRVFQPGNVIMEAGRVCKFLYIIKSGNCKVYLSNSSTHVTELSTRDHFGEQALARAGALSTVTVVASTPTICMVLDPEDFGNMFDESTLRRTTKKRGAISTGARHTLMSKVGKLPQRHVTKTHKEFLHSSMKSMIMFSSESRRNKVIPYMTRIEYAAETLLDNRSIYVVETGSLHVTNDFGTNSVFAGDCHGEMEFLGGQSSPSTQVEVCEPSVVWQLGFDDYRTAMRQRNASEIYMIYEFLSSKVPLLQDMWTTELRCLSELVRIIHYSHGEIIYKPGEPSSTNVYIVLTGHVVINSNESPVTLGVGALFGHSTVETNQKLSTGTCCASGTVQCLIISSNIARVYMPNIVFDGVPLQSLSERISIGPTFIDTKLDQLIPIGVLGQGTYGTVILVVDPTSNDHYALKRMDKLTLVDLEQEQHILDERIILGMVSHPFIIPLRQSYKTDTALYLLFDPMLGGDMFELLQSRTLLNEHDARFYIGSLLLGIEYLHSLDIIHRDIKPENIMFGNDGYILLIDFGFAKVISDKTYSTVGTPGYMSPEVLLGIGHSKATDYWGIGVLLYELLAGCSPFYDENASKFQHNILKCQPVYPKHWSPNAIDLLSQLLRPDPLTRLISPSAFKRHPWFNTFKWDKLLSKDLIPPFIPEIVGPEDLTHFKTLEYFRPDSTVDDFVDMFGVFKEIDPYFE